ncbi:electron transfer flavoprotein beta subunit [Elysia marginata]|uniref:Electron transfer flavoprotein subunit beta n=1 Tax=Elysia marginata TaxID=1093978 RepID=A0AAV4FVD9_9GAST|nr:electron transfer flavoprotein beta subunit [Elysia marginata]
MNILVCLSNVPDTASKIKISKDGTKIDSEGLQFVINPNDEFGLTRAIQLKEVIGATLTAVCVGEKPTDQILRKALAIGVDRAIRVNASPTDSLFTSKQIENIFKNGNFDCVIAGKESIDYNGGCVAAMLSARLNIPYVNNCISMEINGNKARCIREINGEKETLSVQIPFVMSSQKGLVEKKDLKIPNMRGIMQARQKTIEVIEATAHTLTHSIKKYGPLPQKEPVELIASDEIDKLVSVLNKKGKIFQ